MNTVDGCIPIDLGAGARDEIEEERRLLYVAMTRAKVFHSRQMLARTNRTAVAIFNCGKLRLSLHDPKSQAIVTATINLAQALKIETTAEGVETVEQLEALRRAGASQAQGYLFAKPMPENDIPAFLSQTRLLKPAPYAA